MTKTALKGWQRLWVVFAMIWVVLVAAADIPDLPDEGPAVEWAKSQIDAVLQRYEASLPSDTMPGTAPNPMAAEDRYRYVDLAGYSAKPLEDFVDFALAGNGRRVLGLICARHPSCPATTAAAGELASIRSQLDRQLADAHSERQQILLKTLLMSLLPPVLALLIGIGVSRAGPGRK